MPSRGKHPLLAGLPLKYGLIDWGNFCNVFCYTHSWHDVLLVFLILLYFINKQIEKKDTKLTMFRDSLFEIISLWFLHILNIYFITWFYSTNLSIIVTVYEKVVSRFFPKQYVSNIYYLYVQTHIIYIYIYANLLNWILSKRSKYIRHCICRRTAIPVVNIILFLFSKSIYHCMILTFYIDKHY